MIREYALEPEVLSDWSVVRHFLEKFSVPQGRLISAFPKDWKRLVYEGCSRCGDVDIKRIVEKLRTADRRMMQRCQNYDSKRTWVENAIESHGKQSFHAILACEAVTEQPTVLAADDLPDSHPLWAEKHSRTIARTPDAMAEATVPLLKISRRVVFIDPYFRPSDPDCRLPLKKMLEETARCDNRAPNLEYHLGDGTKTYDDMSPTSFENFRDSCKEHLENCIPRGWQVSLVRWRQKCLHNRYILTNRGAIHFGMGLNKATSTSPQNDEVALLDEDVRLGLWKQYVDREDQNMKLADGPSSVIVNGRG